MTVKKKKVLLGMSGGVDSSVSAALLLDASYEVVGAFMKNWSDCSWREDKRDAERVAAKLGIDFHVFDFEAEYHARVVENLFSEYAAGRTPNPDVLCNKYVKFDLFVRAADELGCEFVATGHYARLTNGQLAQPQDLNKDQTYFLWAMPREVLPRVLLPLSDLTKPEVRQIAKDHGLHVARKKDSTGICFIGEVDLMEFLQERIPPNPAPIITTDGKHVGEHRGLAYHTIGQREGLGVVGGGPPYYVVRKDVEHNALIVGTEVDPALFSRTLTASQLNWLVDFDGVRPRSGSARVPLWHLFKDLAKFCVGARAGSDPSFDCLARIRYRQDLQSAYVRVEGEHMHVAFDQDQRAVTPGQSVVLYTKDGIVLGGGVIE